MAEESAFRNAILFLDELGVYDVILPFLLIFTIMFAILEKTKVLGTEKVGEKIYTKKNLNAVVAFVASFLVIASTKLVAVVNETIANVALVLVAVVSFLILVGVFFGSKEFTLENYPAWIKFFMILMFIAVVAIVLNALGWLELIIGVLILNFNAAWVSTLLLLIIVLAFIAYIVHEPKPEQKAKS